MGLKINGTTIDSSQIIKYNSNELDAVQYNGIKVWEKISEISVTDFFSIGYYKSGDNFIYSGTSAWYGGSIPGSTLVTYRDVYPTNFEVENWVYGRDQGYINFVGKNWSTSDFGQSANGYGFSYAQGSCRILVYNGNGSTTYNVTGGVKQEGNLVYYPAGIRRRGNAITYFSYDVDNPQTDHSSWDTSLPNVFDFSSASNNVYMWTMNSGSLMIQKNKKLKDLDTNIQLTHCGIGTQLDFGYVKTLKQVTATLTNTSAPIQVSYSVSTDGTTFSSWNTTSLNTNINVQASKVKLKVENTSATVTTNINNLKIIL